MITLGKSKKNWNWHAFTVSILEVLNNFIKNVFTTKSSSSRSPTCDRDTRTDRPTHADS